MHSVDGTHQGAQCNFNTITYNAHLIAILRQVHMELQHCHGSTGSPSALMRRVLRGGVTVLEGAGILARGTRLLS